MEKGRGKGKGKAPISLESNVLEPNLLLYGENKKIYPHSSILRGSSSSSRSSSTFDEEMKTISPISPAVENSLLVDSSPKFEDADFSTKFEDAGDGVDGWSRQKVPRTFDLNQPADYAFDLNIFPEEVISDSVDKEMQEVVAVMLKALLPKFF
ncbi:hypothetical protein COLO4_10109 [Corchorus olitorius]|uniref:Uncharacterized protein n=1 Tax=Corchorus olitorius TaxID=93759 RepID=A0A1R3KA27_9ROSI|nr:hypothetical protein COLO4_10109 [Corchorus olitorius]